MDIQAALKEGYTQEEIMSELGRRTGMDYQSAMKEGYSSDEVLAELNKRDILKSSPKIMGVEPPTPEWAGKYPNLYGLYGAGRELYRTVGKPAIETVGMVGGGLLGAASPVPGGGFMGAGLGYGAARNATGALDQLFETERGMASPTIGQRIKSNVQDLALGALGGPVPKTATVPRVVNPAFDSLTGVTLSPAEQTGSKTLAQVESLLEQVPFASDVMQNWRQEKQLKPLIALREKYLQAGLENTPRGEVLGQQIKDAIEKRLSQFDQAKVDATDGLRDAMLKKLGSSESYESLSKGAQEVIGNKSAVAVSKVNDLYKDIGLEGTFETPEMAKVAEGWAARKAELPNVSGELKNELLWAKKEMPLTPEQQQLAEGMKAQGFGQELIDKALKEAGYEGGLIKRNWQTLQDYRAQLNKLIAGEDLSIKNGNPALKGQLSPEGLIYKEMKAALDKDFEAIAEKAGGDTLNKFKLANAYYSTEYAPVWKQKTIRDLAYKKPSDVVDVAIKPGSTTEIDLTKKALGEEEFNKTIKPAFTNKLLGQGNEGAFNPAQFEKALNSYGNETLLKIYSPSELATLREIAKTGQLILDKELPNASILKTIASNTPNTIVDSIVGSVERLPNSKTVLKNITALNDFLSPAQKEGVKLELMEKVFRLNNTTQQVEPGTMAKNIQIYQRVLEKYFKPEELKDLDNIALVGRMMTRAQQLAANPSGTAKNVIAWGLANQLLFSPIEPLMKGDVAGAGQRVGMGLMTAVLGPKALAKLYVSETGRKLIVKGMMTKQGTREGIDVARKISIILGNDLNDQE